MSRLPLDRWKPQEPPKDFLQRLDLALDREAARPPSLLRRRGLLAGLSAAAVAAGIGAVWGNLTLSKKILSGSLAARVRTEIAVARGVVAVVEPGARISFQDDLIVQHEGEVAYRTEPEANLRLSTPAGAAEGRGACCRVRVINNPEPDLETTGPATVLALFQGEVTLRHGERSERIAPGGYALASGGTVRTEREDRQGRIARSLSLPAPPPPPTREAPAADTAPSSPPASASAPSRPRSRPTASVAPPSSASAPAAPSPSAPASARPFIVPRCICVPGDSMCACPELPHPPQPPSPGRAEGDLTPPAPLSLKGLRFARISPTLWQKFPP
jgi:hypothetical protein